MAAPTTRSHSLCQFRVIDDEPNRNPLHLRMQQDTCHSLFDKAEELTIVVSLECCQSEKPSTGSTRLFAVVEKNSLKAGPAKETADNGIDVRIPSTEVINSQQTDHIKTTHTILLCSNQFLSHYGFRADDTIVVARPVQIFPLTKVVVAVTSDRSLTWAQNKFFSTGLLLSVCQQTVLVRQDDVLLAPHNILFSHDEEFHMGIFSEMRVVTCEPVQQGRLTVNTEIVIVDRTETTGQGVLIKHCSYVQTQIKERLCAHDDRSLPLLLSDFALGAKGVDILSDIHALIDEKPVGEGDIDQHTTGTLEPSIVYSMSKMCSILSLGDSMGLHDLDNMIGISGRTLCSMGLFDGSLAQIEIDGSTNWKARQEEHKCGEGPIDDKKNSRSKETGKRTVKVHVADGEDVQDGIVYMTPGLSFNICKKTIKKGTVSLLKMVIKKSALPDDNLSLGTADDLSSSWSWSGTIPYIAEMHISVVNSPYYAVSINTNVLLKEYFTIPRLVKKGDVLSISSQLDADYCGVELSDGSGGRQPVVYFKVVRIHPALPSISTYWVDTRHTVLFQDGSVNSYVPTTMRMLLHGDESVLPPPGMTQTTKHLVKTLQPHLYHRRLVDDPVPLMLLVGQAGSGKRMLTKAVAAALHLHLYQVNAYELCGDTSSSTEARVRAMMVRATTYAPCILHLRNIHVFGKAADGNTEEPRTASAFHRIVHQALTDHDKWPVLVIASTAHAKQVSTDLYESFLHQTTLAVPTESERRDMILEMFKCLGTVGGTINVTRIAQRTAGFVLGDLYALIGQAHRHGQSRLFKYCSVGRTTGLSWQEEEDLVMAGVILTQHDFESALDNLQSAHSESIGAPKIPQVSWDDVGGLVSVKSEILDTIQLPLQHPELLSAGLRRSGVLLYGPPGTGKTLLAKAVATECSLNFLSVKGPELINMYVGQSEENIREVFQRARDAAPCVIFFDELDSLAPNRGRSGDSGGVMDRVVSQLLAELDGMSKAADVFVIGATNRPDLLDPALLRPGRFDKLLYLGVSPDKASQLKVLTALTRKFVLAPGCVLERVVDHCPLNMTGADFYALCSDAMLNALKRKIALLEQGVTVDEGQVEVEEEDFQDAQDTLIPSVSVAELGRYQALQAEFNSQKANKIPH